MTDKPITFTSGGVSDVPRQQEPAFGLWPYWVEYDKRWRNGREAGAYIAGLVAASPEKCGQVEVPTGYADGAALAMISAGLSVEGFSSSETTVTFRVRVAWLVWQPAE